MAPRPTLTFDLYVCLFLSLNLTPCSLSLYLSISLWPPTCYWVVLATGVILPVVPRLRPYLGISVMHHFWVMNAITVLQVLQRKRDASTKSSRRPVTKESHRVSPQTCAGIRAGPSPTFPLAQVPTLPVPLAQAAHMPVVDGRVVASTTAGVHSEDVSLV